MITKSCWTLVLLLLSNFFSYSQNNTPSTLLNEPNGTVRAMASYNSVVYIGGEFSSVAGQTREKIAAINLSTGVVTNFFDGVSGANGTIRTMAVNSDGTKLYVGGEFTSIRGQSRNYAACINLSDGSIDTWNPNLNGYVNDIKISGSTVYLGGGFTQVGSTTRNRIAAIGTDGTLDSWNPNASDGINSITLDGSNVYLGGAFTTIGGVARNRAAAISTAGTLQSWDPNFDNAVYCIAIDGSTAYVGGVFGYVGGGSLASSSGAPTSSNTVRSRLAAFDKTSGSVLAFNPAPNSTVNTIWINGSSIYVGGSFTNIGGESRSYMAGVGTGGNTMVWNASATGGDAYAMFVDASNLYVGGTFTTPRSKLARFDNAVTPVTWQSFVAEKQGIASLLKWSTASEQNTKDFEVQHSINTISWAPLGTVAAAGNSTTTRSYSFVHNTPFKGNIYNYYRILQRDLDGKFSYSKIASLIYDEPAADVLVYPNPAAESLTIYIAESKEVKLVNVVGATVWRGTLQAGRNQLNLQPYAKGVYWVITGGVKKQIIIQ